MTANVTAEMRREQGFDSFVLRNSEVELVIVPELGAKVVSLINLRSGRQWMAHPGGELTLFRNRYGDDFASSMLAGWDECLPTIAPCECRGRRLPDHGEVWSCPWAVDMDAWQQGIIRTSINLAVTPFEFHRSISLSGGDIHIDYSLVNVGSEPEPFLWAMHPLFSIHQRDCLELTEEIRAQLGRHRWLDSLDFGKEQPACCKTYAGPLQEGIAGIFNARTGDRLNLAWDTLRNPVLGLWLTRGGWHGQHHLALEPANGMTDSLAAAVQQDHHAILAAHSAQAWSVRLRIGPRTAIGTKPIATSHITKP